MKANANEDSAFRGNEALDRGNRPSQQERATLRDRATRASGREFQRLQAASDIFLTEHGAQEEIEISCLEAWNAVWYINLANQLKSKPM